MMTREDLDLDLAAFFVKAATHMQGLSPTDTEGVLRTFTIVAGRMVKAYEAKKPASNAELHLLWSLFGMATGASYQIWARLNQLEGRLLNLERDRHDAEQNTDSDRAH